MNDTLANIALLRIALKTIEETKIYPVLEDEILYEIEQLKRGADPKTIEQWLNCFDNEAFYSFGQDANCSYELIRIHADKLVLMDMENNFYQLFLMPKDDFENRWFIGQFHNNKLNDLLELIKLLNF